MDRIYAIMCTPNMNRPTAIKALQSLKKTNLSDVELVIADNCYDVNFCHPVEMQRYLDYANGQPVVFIDDDVIIDDHDWLSKLLKCADTTQADIVGGVHTYPTGELNHAGVMIYLDGSTELLRETPKTSFPFVPAVSSALLLIAKPGNINIDTDFSKYQHDIDLSLKVWKNGGKVSCAWDLEVVHHLADYMSKKNDFRKIYAEDTEKLKNKWAEFVSTKLYRIRELADFAKAASETNWEQIYNEASLCRDRKDGRALELFTKIILDCPYDWRRGNAHYHIYILTGDKNHLKDCLSLNPYHGKARDLLIQ